MRHLDDYTALSNWMTHNEVRDIEITSLVLKLADQGLREMLEIISRVSDWAGGKEQAMAWYRAQPLPAFGGRTAEALVKDGKTGAVRDYLDHMAVGGFA